MCTGDGNDGKLAREEVNDFINQVAEEGDLLHLFGLHQDRLGRFKVSNKQAAAALDFAVKQNDEAMVFLRLWTHGNSDAIRREWPDCPESVFEDGDESEITELREENKRLKDELKKIYETKPEGWQDPENPRFVGRARLYGRDTPP